MVVEIRTKTHYFPCLVVTSWLLRDDGLIQFVKPDGYALYINKDEVVYFNFTKVEK